MVGRMVNAEPPTLRPWLLIVSASVPGRMRIRIPLLYRNPALKAALLTELSGLSRVRSVEASTLTATVLIVGERDLGIADLVPRLAEILGAPGEVAEPSPPSAPRPISRLGPRLDTIEHVARAARGRVRGFPQSLKGVARRLARSLTAEPTPDTARRVTPRRAAPVTGEARPWHCVSIDQLLDSFESSARGLSPEQARMHLERDGLNLLESAERRSELAIFMGQLKSVPVILLAGSAVLSALTGGVGDAVMILAVVAVNAGIGYATESHAERVISSLEQGGQATARVLRDDTPQDVAIEEVVVGDVLTLEPGMFVAADARVLSSDMLLIDESALTGESVPALKRALVLDDPHMPLGERCNMAFRGTLVTGGSGHALVTGVGSATEIGTVQRLAGSIEQRQTPLQQQLDRLGTQLAVISGAACGAVFAIGILRGYPLLQMLKVSISLAVAAIPEGLPTVAVTTLALGIRRMQSENVYVRQLAAVETLGAIQVLCLDKTGTITLNRMTVVALYCGKRRVDASESSSWSAGFAPDGVRDPDLTRLLEVLVLCNETELNELDGALVLKGSSTESALVQLALDCDMDARSVRGRYPVVATRYRSETRSFMSTLHQSNAHGRLAVKGRASEVLAMCSHQLCNGQVLPLSDADREAVLQEEEKMASRALRVLGAAFRDDSDLQLETENDLVWLGLVGMSDPPREGLRELMASFHRAGIHTVMITGDQSATASAIGRDIGLSRDGRLEILDSVALEKLDPSVLSAMAERVHVFSRVSPGHKLSIVQALQRAGRVVAMTGDGINDSPALKAADVGIAMGAGTAAAREMADVVIQDDNLATMIRGIEQGRTIYDDIRKAVHMMIATNSSEILLTLLAMAAGLGETLTPLQLLWVNVVTDIFPELALAVQPPESDVLERPPRAANRRMFDALELQRIGVEGGVLTLSALVSLLYGRALYGEGPRSSTITLTSLLGSHMLHTLSARSVRHSIFDKGRLARNPYMPLALGTSFGLHLVATALPGTRKLFNLALPAPLDVAVSAACAVAPFFVNEFIKVLWREPPDRTRVHAGQLMLA